MVAVNQRQARIGAHRVRRVDEPDDGVGDDEKDGHRASRYAATAEVFGYLRSAMQRLVDECHLGIRAGKNAARYEKRGSYSLSLSSISK